MNSTLARIGFVLRSMMNKRSLTVVSIALILIALPLTVYLNQQRQDIRQRASSGLVCRQGEFTDLSSNVDIQKAVYCLSTDPYCIVQGTPADAGGSQFQGSRNILRSEAVAFIVRYHVSILGDWQMVTPTGTVFSDVPATMNLAAEIETSYKYGFIKGNVPNPGQLPPFQPNDEWIYGMHGIIRAEYFNDSGAIYPTGAITRDQFIVGLYNYGSSKGQLSVCNPQTVTRCSTIKGCTRTTFQSVDGGTHPIGDITYTTDVSCPQIPNGDNTACPAATQPPLPAPTCTGAAPAISIVTDPNMNLIMKATGVQNTQSIKFPTWSDVNGQDDLVWYPGTDVGGGVWQTTIPVTAHTKGDVNTGHVTTHVYVYNTSAPNGVMCAATGFTVQPATYMISGVVSGGTGAITVNARTSAGAAPITTQTTATGTYSFSNLTAGYYTVSLALPSGYTQTSSVVNYGINLGSSCSIIPAGTIASCGTDGSVSKANFAIGITPPTPTPTTAIVATNTPVPDVPTATTAPLAPTATPTSAPNTTKLAVSFRQHGIGLPADNANPNPTIAAGVVIPTPVQSFSTRPVTVYLSTGATVNDGVLVYEYKKSGSVTFTNGNGLYGYTGTVDLGTDIPSGQYIVAIRTDNSLSQQATGFTTVTPGQTIALSFPALISGNVYDTTIDNSTPVNDNQLDILDYNAIMDNWLNPDLCNGKTGTELQVCQTIQTRADLNADGAVDVLDYNLFIRELSVQRGR